MLDAHAVASLLDQFKKLPRRIERPQTFMEVGGYAHSEAICSNFLAFFFDPEGPHGLGGLFLEALLDSVDGPSGEEGFEGNVSVEREATTQAGNRIDILIRAESRAVLIENKIYAAAVNPFDDYAIYLDRLRNENGVAYENKNKILLTLYPSHAGVEYGFVNLTHRELVSAVRSALGHHISEAEPRYLPLLLDFLNTLESFTEGTRMNHEYINLLVERSDEVEEFLKGLSEVRAELKAKVQELEALVDVNSYQNIHTVPWKQDIPLAHYLHIRVFVDILDKRSFVFLDTRLSLSGWEIQIDSRGPEAPKRPELEELLNKLDIEFESDWRCIYPKRFAYDEDLSRVAPVVTEIVDKFSRHYSHRTALRS